MSWESLPLVPGYELVDLFKKNNQIVVSLYRQRSSDIFFARLHYPYAPTSNKNEYTVVGHGPDVAKVKREVSLLLKRMACIWA